MSYKKINIILIIVIIILSLSSLFFLTLLNFQEDFTKIVRKQLKNYISSPYQIETAQISPFRNFPNIAVLVKNVIINEMPEAGNKPLLTINKLYFQLNFWSFFRHRFVVEKIEIEDVNAWAKTDKNGRPNYLILISDTTGSSSVDLDLKKIVVKNATLNYLSEKVPFAFSTNIDRLNLKGLFQSDKFKLTSKFEGSIHYLLYDSTNVFSNIPVSFNSDILVNSSEGLYQINHFESLLDETSWIIKGKVISEKELYLDLNILSNNIKLAEIVRLLPVQNKDTLSNYSFDGKVSMSAAIKGHLSEKSFPSLNIDFALENSQVTMIKENITFDNINMKAVFSNKNFLNKRNGDLNIYKSELYVKGKKISATGRLTDLNHPSIEVSLNAEIDPALVSVFVKSSEIKGISGDATINLNYKGYLDSLLALKLNSGVLIFAAKFNNLSFTYQNYQIQKIQGEIFSDPSLRNVVVLKQISGVFDETSFSIDGKIADYYCLFDSTGGLADLKMKVKLGYLDISKYTDVKTRSSDNQNNGYTSIIFPSGISYLLNVNCDKIKFQNFQADKISTVLNYNGKEISFTKTILNTAKGKLSGYGKIFNTDNNGFQVDGIVQMSRMEIKEVFKEMNNFDQDYITSEHISGLADGQIEFSMKIDKNLIPDESSIFCLADIVMTNGNIKNFEPLENLFGFIKMKKLKDVWFDKLENTILINEKVITIPTMNVRNSAFNIELSGTHTFDNHIDYIFKVNLTDIFFKKYHQTPEEFEATEMNARGGINIYVSMTGTVDNYKLKYEQPRAKETFKVKETQNKEKIQQKSSNIKKTIQPEVELFWEDE